MSDYRVQFEIFEGPLDLLLHLVKKEEVDIYQVNLTKIATEFIAYLEQLKELDLEVAGEFLVMAATLIYIKSRELLPVDKQVRPEGEDEDADDPRWELIRRLVEYKKFKDAASQLQTREWQQENTYERRAPRPDIVPEDVPTRRGEASLFDLISAVSVILKRYGSRSDTREIFADPFTVSEKIDELRTLAQSHSSFRFSTLFEAARTRTEVVVTFLALLELIRMKLFVAAQNDEFGEIEISLAPPPSSPQPSAESQPQDPNSPSDPASQEPPQTN